MGLVCLDSYDDLNSAQIARGVLAASDVPAFVFDDGYLDLAWYMTTALGGVRLMVPGERLAEARDALQAARASAIVRAGIDTCPNCDSQNVSRLYSWLSAAGSLVLFMLTVTAVPILFDRSRRRCRDCDHHWSAPHDV